MTGSSRLPAELAAAIEDSAGDCWLSPVSIWELGKWIERGRIEISGDYRGWVDQARRGFPVRDAALNHEVALTSLELELATKDPADRFLAATALAFQVELATLDRELIAAPWLPTRPS